MRNISSHTLFQLSKIYSGCNIPVTQVMALQFKYEVINKPVFEFYRLLVLYYILRFYDFITSRIILTASDNDRNYNDFIMIPWIQTNLGVKWI